MKYRFLFISIIAFIVFSFKILNDTFPIISSIDKFRTTEFVSVLEKKVNPNKNVIYSSTLPYAWNEVKNHYNVKELTIDSIFKDLRLLNKSNSHLNSIEEHKLTKETFIDGNNVSINVSYKLNLDFKAKLDTFDSPLNFLGTDIKSFGINNNSVYEQKAMFDVLYYKNNHEFVIRINPKDTSQELYLYMPEISNISSLKKVYYEMNNRISKGKYDKKSKINAWKYILDDNDIIEIPNLKFNIENHFKSIENSVFKINNKSYLIDTCKQTIAMALNRNGAFVESKAVIALYEGDDYTPNHTKYFIFEKPFLIVMKRKSEVNPYFVAWIANTELMEFVK